MAYLPILSAKMAVKYAIEATAGAGRPTSGYTTINGVKSISADNDAPNTAQVTELKDYPDHVNILALNNSGATHSITVNDYKVFRDSWNTMYTAYTEAAAAGKTMWVEYAYPPGNEMDSYYYPAIPSPLGFGGAEVDAPLENIVHFVKAGQHVFATASTV